MLSLIIKNKSRLASVFSRVAFQKAGIGSNTYQILKENNVIKKYCVQSRLPSSIKTTNRYSKYERI